MENKKNFFGVWIPRDLWLTNDLSCVEKLLLLEILNLDRANYCFASNKHFSQLLGLTKSRCSQILSSLEKKGMIKKQYKRDGKRIVERRIVVLKKFNFPVKYINEPIEKMPKGKGSGNDNRNMTATRQYIDKDLDIANCVYDQLKKTHQNYQEPDLEDWAVTINIMCNKENRNHIEIHDTICWAVKDSYWSIGINSVETLRRNFDKIIISRLGSMKNVDNRQKKSWKGKSFWDDVD